MVDDAARHKDAEQRTGVVEGDETGPKDAMRYPDMCRDCSHSGYFVACLNKGESAYIVFMVDNPLRDIKNFAENLGAVGIGDGFHTSIDSTDQPRCQLLIM